MENVKNYNVENLLGMDKNLVSVAGEWPAFHSIMLGILRSKIKPEVLSYEGPFGVGYLVALLTPVKEEDT